MNPIDYEGNYQAATAALEQHKQTAAAITQRLQIHTAVSLYALAFAHMVNHHPRAAQLLFNEAGGLLDLLPNDMGRRVAIFLGCLRPGALDDEAGEGCLKFMKAYNALVRSTGRCKVADLATDIYEFKTLSYPSLSAMPSAYYQSLAPADPEVLQMIEPWEAVLTDIVTTLKS